MLSGIVRSFGMFISQRGLFTFIAFCSMETILELDLSIVAYPFSFVHIAMTSRGARETFHDRLLKERRKETRKARKEVRRAFWAEAKATKARKAKSVHQTEEPCLTCETVKSN